MGTRTNDVVGRRARGRILAGCLLALLTQYAITGLGSDFGETGSRSFASMADRMLGSSDSSAPAAASRLRPPGYPMLLAVVSAVTPAHWEAAARLVQGLIGLGSLLLVHRLSWLVFRDRGICTVAVVLYVADFALHKERLSQRDTALFEFLILLFAVCALSWSGSRGRAVVASALAAMAFLTRPTGLALLPALLALVALGVPGPRTRWRTALACLVAFELVLLPWQLYQSHTFGEPTLGMPSNGGVNLYKGNAWQVASIYPAVDPDDADFFIDAGSAGMSELERDSFLRSRAIADIRAEPGEFLRRTLEKAMLSFSPIEVPFGEGTVAEDGRGGLVVNDYRIRLGGKAMTQFPFAFLVLPLGLIGLVRSLRQGGVQTRWAVLAGTVIAGNVLIYAVTFAQLRFRMPLDGLFCVSAASVLQHVFSRGTALRRPGSGLSRSRRTPGRRRASRARARPGPGRRRTGS